MSTPRSDPNWLGALFSFLRLLAVAEASALIPLFTFVNPADRPTLGVVAFALVPPFLLTVVNFFREGETRFGTPPNPGRPDVSV